MTKTGKTTFMLQWQDRDVEVSYEEKWLSTECWHLELRCADILPVTETGYRSAFLPQGAIGDASEISAYVSAWLDETAKDPQWQKRLEASRQLKLF